jgi:AcrR family transcriptional regulator
VYRLFSSKIGILKALLDVSIAGDDEAVALEDRLHVRALLSDRDPRNQLSGLARSIRGIMSRAEPLHRILVSAADSDPDAAALLAELLRQRQHGHAQIARSLARAGAPRPNSASATLTTSFTQSRPPRYTGLSSATEPGHPSGTNSG